MVDVKDLIEQLRDPSFIGQEAMRESAAEALSRLSGERDELKAELARLYDTRRWNIERDGNDLLICEGDHHRSEKCEFERYARAETAERQHDEAIERAALAARQVAINAERRAADHVPQSAAANAALDKSEGAYAAEAAIRQLKEQQG